MCIYIEWTGDCGSVWAKPTNNPPPPNHHSQKGGPPLCRGQNLAYMQLQYTLALLVLAFDIAAVDGGKGVAMNQKSPTLPMREGVRVRLTRRAAE